MSMKKYKSQKKEKPRKKRAWKSEQLPKVFTVRANEDEHKKLKKLSRKTGWSMSRLVVESTINNGIRPKKESQHKNREETERIIYAVNRVGVNLNQLCVGVNSALLGKGAMPTERAIVETLEEINALVNKLHKKI